MPLPAHDTCARAVGAAHAVGGGTPRRAVSTVHVGHEPAASEMPATAAPGSIGASQTSGALPPHLPSRVKPLATSRRLHLAPCVTSRADAVRVGRAMHALTLLVHGQGGGEDARELNELWLTGGGHSLHYASCENAFLVCPRSILPSSLLLPCSVPKHECCHVLPCSMIWRGTM